MTQTKRKHVNAALFTALLAALLLCGAGWSWAGQTPGVAENQSVHRKLDLTVGESRVLDLTGDPTTGTIVFASAAPDILEAKWLETKQLYLRGKASGFTTLSICEKKKDCVLYDVRVTPDIVSLKQTLGDLLPGEKGVRVSADNDRITLSGRVSDPASLPQILALAESYAPNKVTNLVVFTDVPDTSRLKENIHEILPEEKDVKVTQINDMLTLTGMVSSTTNLSQVMAVAEAFAPGKVLNLLEVGGVHQVMLEVRIAEVSRGLSQRMGVNFSWLSDSGQNFGASLLGNLSVLEGDAASGSSPINAFFRFFGYDTTWTVFIDALKSTGLVKILAEPTLITLSGQTAEFLAGGEFPIPVPQELGVITIEYKEYGVGLRFTPTVLNNDKISMKVQPEVSNIDFSTAVAAGGVAVPGLTTRRMSTTIELDDGQSFAIGGLLQSDIREIVDKFPILGDIPVLGVLFRSSSFQKNETELLISATCHLVKPLDMTQQTLPTDQFIEPDDFEFFMLGRLEGRGADAPQSSPALPPAAGESGGMEGDFGHIVPK